MILADGTSIIIDSVRHDVVVAPVAGPPGGGGGTGLVSAVFGRIGNVIAQAGDYAAFYDALGAATAAQQAAITAADTYTDGQVSAEATARAAAIVSATANLLAKAQGLADLPDIPLARTHLGLGDIATHSASEFVTPTQQTAALAALVGSAPGLLDTLAEIDAAIGNDPNFATTISTALATKAADSTVVHNTGAETIAGIKTFSSAPVVPDGSLAQVKIAGLAATLALLAPLDSPALTGSPTAPTPAPGDNSTKLANTAFVSAALSGVGGGSGMFGDGSDGAATIASVVVLTKDTHYTDLTITAAGQLIPDGYRVYVSGTLTVNVGGALHMDGASGNGNSAGGARGSNTRPLGQGSSGADATNTGPGNAGATMGNPGIALGGRGGFGGASGANAGGTSTAVGATWTNVQWVNTWRNPISLFLGGIVLTQQNGNTQTAIAGGGSGGGSGANDGTGSFAGNPSGGGGGVLVVNAATVINNGRISANGGAGLTANARNGGGGGGGGGGVVFLNCKSLTGNQPQANGGAGGGPFGTGLAGNAGGNGVAHVYLVV